VRCAQRLRARVTRVTGGIGRLDVRNARVRAARPGRTQKPGRPLWNARTEHRRASPHGGIDKDERNGRHGGATAVRNWINA